MTEDELTGRERRRVITAGRSVICHLAARELGKRREASFYPLLVLTFLPPKPLRGGTMVKEGEKFRDKETGKIYVVRWVDKGNVILFGADREETDKRIQFERHLRETGTEASLNQSC